MRCKSRKSFPSVKKVFHFHKEEKYKTIHVPVSNLTFVSFHVLAASPGLTELIGEENVNITPSVNILFVYSLIYSFTE